MRFKNLIIETANLSGLPRLLTSSFGGLGAILAMHRVREPSGEPFQPNRTLEVTPAFLDGILTHLRELAIEIVSLDEAHRRLMARDVEKRFVCLTLDDGYADNYLEALPVFKKHDAPFSIYATTGFLDHSCFFWWMILEEVIRARAEVVLRANGEEYRVTTRTPKEKEGGFATLHHCFRAFDADQVEPAALRLCDEYGIDPAGFCARHAMTWDMAREITEDGLGTIEAHTERHLALSLQRPEDIHAEMTRSCTRIAEKTGRTPRHFAYPFGDARAVNRGTIDVIAGLSFDTATTTRSDVLRAKHADCLASLPRITLNGYYQSDGYVDLQLSGLPSLMSLRA